MKTDNRGVHALACIMGNKGKMGKNSKVCKEVQNDEKFYDMQFWVFYFTDDMRSKVWQNKFGENGYCRNYFILKRVSAIHIL